MVIKKNRFEYKNTVLIERAVVAPPYKQESIFQNQGCFIHVKGTGSQLISAEGTFPIKDQNSVLLNGGTYFVDILESAESKTFEVIVFHLYPEILTDIYKDELPEILKRQPQPNPAKMVVQDSVISRFIDSLEFYFQNPELVNDDLLELKMKQLILLLIQTKNADSIYQLVTDLFSTKKVQLKKVVDQHVYSNLSLDEWSKLCNLSLTSFKREFKKTFGQPPSQYINAQKIRKSKELLMMTDLTVAQVAFGVGYNDPLYFTRIFNKKRVFHLRSIEINIVCSIKSIFLVFLSISKSGEWETFVGLNTNNKNYETNTKNNNWIFRPIYFSTWDG